MPSWFALKFYPTFVPNGWDIMRSFIFYLVIVILAGCRSDSNASQHLAQWRADFQAVQHAQEQAAQLWDQLIIEGSADCSIGLPTLSPLELTADDLRLEETLPTWVTLLNQAISLVQQSAQLWDILCLNPDPLVLPSDANQGYLWMQEAQGLLEQAAALQSAWNP
jgi:hypothetical protein